MNDGASFDYIAAFGPGHVVMKNISESSVRIATTQPIGEPLVKNEIEINPDWYKGKNSPKIFPLAAVYSF